MNGHVIVKIGYEYDDCHMCKRWGDSDSPISVTSKMYTNEEEAILNKDLLEYEEYKGLRPHGYEFTYFSDKKIGQYLGQSFKHGDEIPETITFDQFVLLRKEIGIDFYQVISFEVDENQGD